MHKQLACVVSALVVTLTCSSNASAPFDDAHAQSAGAGVKAGGPEATPEPEARRVKEVVIPAGTTIRLALDTALSSDKSRAEDPVRARLVKPIVIDGMIAVPSGAEATGSVLAARRSGRVKGRASVAFRFDRLRFGAKGYAIRTARIVRIARATKGEDAEKIGIGAGAGALIGAIAGGKKGAAIGGAAGAGAGTSVVLSTRGREVRLGRGSVVKATLQEPLAIQVPL